MPLLQFYQQTNVFNFMKLAQFRGVTPLPKGKKPTCYEIKFTEAQVCLKDTCLIFFLWQCEKVIDEQ